MGTVAVLKPTIPEQLAKSAFTAPTTSEESTESSESNEPLAIDLLHSSFQTEEATTIYHTSQILRRYLWDCFGLSCTWPPHPQTLAYITQEKLFQALYSIPSL